MRVVVTGGAGFIGSHLLGRLLARGDEVLCVDSLLTGSRENLSAAGGDSRRLTFIPHDISCPLEAPGPVEQVYHLASAASPADYLRYPIQTLKAGALGTHNALGLAKAKGADFLLASSSEVYGDPEVHPQREDYLGRVNPIGPRGVYDEAKRFAEALTMAYHRAHGLRVRIARIFNTYGPRMRLDDGRAIPTFIGQALRGEALTIFGDGLQTRSFCYVDDMVEGLLRLMDRSTERVDFPEPALGGPMNLGNPEEFSILDLARLVLEVTPAARSGSKSPITHLPLPRDDPRVRRPDISRARSLLGWEPRTPLREGLEKTVADFQVRLGLEGDGPRCASRSARLARGEAQ
ncbi:MAG: UDP-glucuronic acid decarboxylase family protein [Nitrospinota bacterium]